MSFIEKLGMKYPIIQAPMAGVTNAEMVIASSNAGIMGSIGAGYLSADHTRELIRNIQAQTKKPFMINLFAHELPPIVQHEIAIAKQALIQANVDEDISRDEMKLSTSVFDEQLDVVIEERVAICSFTFGLPTKVQVNRLKENNIMIAATATTVEEVLMIDELGFDFICLQGEEAGGHRGSFIEPTQYIPIQTLLKQALEVTKTPLVVAGGISTKRQMDDYLANGAVAVMLGTIFVVSHESSAPAAHKNAILHAKKGDTVITSAFSGRPARGIRNSYIEKMLMLPYAPFPYQNDMTKGIRARAAANNSAENLSLWAGMSLYKTEGGTVAEIVERFLNES